jgi:hypothetical protein
MDLEYAGLDKRNQPICRERLGRAGVSPGSRPWPLTKPSTRARRLVADLSLSSSPKGLMFSLDDLERATSVVRSVMPPTPQYAWPLLRRRYGVELVVKHENHTPIGAFKVRGGLTYLHRLRLERAQAKGVVSATCGNHGQSLAFAGRQFGVPVAVVVPHGNSVEKNAAMRAFGAEIIEHGMDFDDARQRAAEIAQERGYEFVPLPSSRCRTMRSHRQSAAITRTLTTWPKAPARQLLPQSRSIGSALEGARSL